MEGYKHLIITFAFILGAFLIDLDHYKLGLKTMISGFFDLNSSPCKDIQNRDNCPLHRPILFYSLTALTLGVYIHFKMDGVL